MRLLLNISLLLMSLLTSHQVLAHAKPQTQSPLANAQLSEAKEIRLQFSETLEPAFCTVQLFNENGEKIPLAKRKGDFFGVYFLRSTKGIAKAPIISSSKATELPKDTFCPVANDLESKTNSILCLPAGTFMARST
mgnify:CR=1 FL=1